MIKFAATYLIEINLVEKPINEQVIKWMD